MMYFIGNGPSAQNPTRGIRCGNVPVGASTPPSLTEAPVLPGHHTDCWNSHLCDLPAAWSDHAVQSISVSSPTCFCVLRRLPISPQGFSAQ